MFIEKILYVMIKALCIVLWIVQFLYAIFFVLYYCLLPHLIKNHLTDILIDVEDIFIITKLTLGWNVTVPEFDRALPSIFPSIV